MIDLRPIEHQTLAVLVKAGKFGVRLSDLTLSAVIRLTLTGHATLERTDDGQRAFATKAGAAFHRRDAA